VREDSGDWFLFRRSEDYCYKFYIGISLNCCLYSIFFFFFFFFLREMFGRNFVWEV